MMIKIDFKKETGVKQVSKHIIFYIVEKTDSKKTNKYKVFNKSGIEVATISWFSLFRKYAVYPKQNMVFDQNCLTDIALFLESINKKHKEKNEKSVSNIS